MQAAHEVPAGTGLATVREPDTLRALRELMANYQVRADSSPTPLAQWRDVAADLRRVLPPQ